MAPSITRELTWAEDGKGSAILFELMIDAVPDEPPAATTKRFYAEAVRMARSFLAEEEPEHA
jgi:hypothetical protein